VSARCCCYLGRNSLQNRRTDHCVLQWGQLMEAEVLLLFVPTIAAVSLTPGLCMTLAFSLGVTIGFRRTLWMMLGELCGVATVIITTLALLSWLLALNPVYLQILATIGVVYLLRIAWQLWHEDSRFNAEQTERGLGASQLVALGYVTAVMNPKGWAFLIALLPGFIAPEAPLAPQWLTMLAIMLTTELLSMSLYAGGGRWMRGWLLSRLSLNRLNRVVAVLMVSVSLMIVLGL